MTASLKHFLLASSIYLLSPSVSAFSLSDAISTGAEALSPATEVNGEAHQLVGQLQSQLGVTETQAVGGAGALLQLAQNQLGTDAINNLNSEASGLTSLLGGSSLSDSLISKISSMDGVQTAFSALGMDAGMIQQFVPLILGFLGDQGVGSSLLGQLQGLWSPAE
ncbi:DUF2780 domain-containing protein [Marinobacter daepoensis]|uniref:DUF2780 domain-containing protein n=1 Tax=Marinobacter daepoensis TaxID=262077 RepID=A0ABS3BJT3_9GAMM|nr:DUF2780 domain-containing protein [Marinobacter daepoensis]MBN7770997.1 DUF2780 domain-containing protein [Marinobacter daepoensis]MBY6033342.1 DUF2780 domain-containing protein [Marinobacter daepoensis]MBY6078859.1 DUF2780 domain-containing protein [Marinobacter daepoensis]